MVVASVALPVELLNETSAARHKARGLVHQPRGSSWTIDVRHHPELAHVPLSFVNCGVPEQVGDARQSPGSRRPRMSVQEMSALLNLELVEGEAEFDVLDCFLSLPVEPRCPP